MLRPRNFNDFKMISLHDDALSDETMQVLAEYESTRDFSLVEKHAGNAVVFTVSPLLVDYEHLVADNPVARKLLVKHHLRGATNQDWLSFVEKSGNLVVSDESIDKLDTMIIDEIYQVIIESQRGGHDRAVFSQVESWRQQRLRDDQARRRASFKGSAQ